jgi:hypothetical protein
MSLVLRSRERLVYGESGVGPEKEEEMCFELGSEREGDGERVEVAALVLPLLLLAVG